MDKPETEGAWEVIPSSNKWPQLIDPDAEICERIYGVGSVDVLNQPCMSVIGARRATPYGLAVAEMAGRIAAECGLVLVSGGAIGCDSAAARAALAAGGKTVVVAGCGANRVYPESSADVFDAAIKGGGAVISLERWGSPPRRYTFPRRNRVIAALSRILVVAEAGVPSGTFSTAQAAAELGRAVYAAPGPIFSPNSRGTNSLLEEGATIIADETSLEEAVAREYGTMRLVTTGPTPDRGRVLSALVAMPMRSDDLARALGENVLTTLKSLAEYETEGLVCKLADGRFAPTRKALAGCEAARKVGS